VSVSVSVRRLSSRYPASGVQGVPCYEEGGDGLACFSVSGERWDERAGRRRMGLVVLVVIIDVSAYVFIAVEEERDDAGWNAGVRS